MTDEQDKKEIPLSIDEDSVELKIDLPVNAHSSDEEPSFVQRAQQAYREIQSNQPSVESLESIPLARPQGHSTPLDDQYQKLFGEIISKQQSSGVFGSVKKHRKSSLIVMSGAQKFWGLVFLFAVAMVVMTLEQKQINQERLDNGLRLRAGIDQSEAAIIALRAAKALRADIPERSALSMHLAAKLAPVSVKKREQEYWKMLMTCVAEAPWTGYRSKSFMKVGEGLFVKHVDDWLYYYTPHMAGKHRLFSGVFWQAKVQQFASIWNGDFSHKFPSRVLALPFPVKLASGKSNELNSYLRIRRGLGFARERLITIGGGDHQARFMPSGYQNMWTSEVPLIDPLAYRVLVDEVEAQIDQFMIFGETILPELRRINTVNYESVARSTFAFCEEAGRHYKFGALVREATFQAERLQKEPEVFQSPNISVLKFGGQTSSFDYGMAKMAWEPFRQCLFLKNMSVGYDFLLQLNVNSVGRLTSVQSSLTGEDQKIAQNCAKEHFHQIRFYGNKKLPTRKIKALVRYD